MKCLCNCGGELPPRTKFNKPDAKFLRGHHTRVLKRAIRNYIPSLEEIPSGICECGCGKPTNKSTYTNVNRRSFRGYPQVCLPGHPRTRRLRETTSGWKGGRTITSEGYVAVIKPVGHPSKRKYILEHRLVMENVLGRYLKSFEQVHHKNGDKKDNRPDNLELWKRKSQPEGVRQADYHCAGCQCA